MLNPGNDNSFIRLVKAKDTRVYVDKTDFIEKTNALFNTDGNLIAVTRRFGKTITAHMLSAYYSKGYADQKIFDNPEISTKDSFTEHLTEHLNKYDVIYIDMNTIDGLFDGCTNKKQKKTEGRLKRMIYMFY
ncbi:MAG: AAA family ATPase [Ruminobacter sp.]|nr:AAA family ATPase [Ruminobacter sp.]